MKYLFIGLLAYASTSDAASVKIQNRERELERQVVSYGECTWRTTIGGKASFSSVVLPVIERVVTEFYQVEVTREGMFGEPTEKIVPDSRHQVSREEITQRSFGLNKDECTLMLNWMKQNNAVTGERK